MRLQILHDRLIESARRTGFACGFFGQSGEWSLPVFTRAGATGKPHVYISSGVHGDEPAGPLAVLQLLRRKLLPKEVGWTILPLVNPLGLERGTRGNADGIDINRDYGPEPRSPEARQHRTWLAGRRFDLALCLHEDTDAHGFYLYELCAEGRPSLARSALDAACRHIPVDTRSVIDGMPARDGIMYPPAELHARDRLDLPEALMLYFEHTPHSLTLETPTCLPVARRVEAQVAATVAVVEALAKLAKT